MALAGAVVPAAAKLPVATLASTPAAQAPVAAAPTVPQVKPHPVAVVVATTVLLDKAHLAATVVAVPVKLVKHQTATVELARLPVALRLRPAPLARSHRAVAVSTAPPAKSQPAPPLVARAPSGKSQPAAQAVALTAPSVKSQKAPSLLVSTAQHLLKTVQRLLFTMAKRLPKRNFLFHPARQRLKSTLLSEEHSS